MATLFDASKTELSVGSVATTTRLFAHRSGQASAEYLVFGGIGVPIQAAETAASVTPVNIGYPKGHLYRYVVNTTPGTTDCSAGVQAALDSFGYCIFPGPEETVQLSTQITLTADARLYGFDSVVTCSAIDVFDCVNFGMRAQGITFSGFTDLFKWTGSGTISENITLNDCRFRDYTGRVIEIAAATLNTSSIINEFRIESCEVSRSYTAKAYFTSQIQDFFVQNAAIGVLHFHNNHCHDGGSVGFNYSPSAGVAAVFDSTIVNSSGNVWKNYRDDNTAADSDVHFWQCRAKVANFSGDHFENLIVGEYGVQDGGDNQSVFTDSSQSWGTNALVGYTINNTTDGSTGTITANTATTITVGAGLSGGTDNDFDNGDIIIVLSGANPDDLEAVRFTGPAGAEFSFANCTFVDAGGEEGMLAGKGASSSTLKVSGGYMTVTPEYAAIFAEIGGVSGSTIGILADDHTTVEGVTFRGFNGACIEISQGSSDVYLRVLNCDFIDCPCNLQGAQAIILTGGTNNVFEFQGNKVLYPGAGNTANYFCAGSGLSNVEIISKDNDLRALTDEIYEIDNCTKFTSDGDMIIGGQTSQTDYYLDWVTGVVDEIIITNLKVQLTDGRTIWYMIDLSLYPQVRKLSVSGIITGRVNAATRPFFYDLQSDGVGRFERKVSCIDAAGNWAIYRREIRVDQEAGGGITTTVVEDGDTGGDWDESASSVFSQADEAGNGGYVIGSSNWTTSANTDFVYEFSFQSVGSP